MRSVGAIPRDVLAVDRLEALSMAGPRLEGAEDVGELFQRGADIARAALGFSRAAVLELDGGTLRAALTEPLDHAPSDALRQTVQAAPIPVTPADTAAIRGGRSEPRHRSPLAERLGLEHHVLVWVNVRGVPLGLLVVDREHPPVDRMDHAVVAGYGAILSSALETVLVRARLDEVTAELRHLAFSSQALLAEVRDAPPSLPQHHGGRLSFGTFEGVPAPSSTITGLTERERVVFGLLAEGLSNREIAERLIVSPETVKAHVARILRKLGAANRAAAVARAFGPMRADR